VDCYLNDATTSPFTCKIDLDCVTSRQLGDTYEPLLRVINLYNANVEQLQKQYVPAARETFSQLKFDFKTLLLNSRVTFGGDAEIFLTLHFLKDDQHDVNDDKMT
jgi:hypothetical protein